MITKKSIRTLALGLLAIATLAGCASDDRVTDLENEIHKLKKQQTDQATITLGEKGRKLDLALLPGEQKTVLVETDGMEDISVTTSDTELKVSYDESEGKLQITAPGAALKAPVKVFITGNDAKGVVYRAIVTCTMQYADPLAMIVLNEGNVFGGEKGFMTYISPVGQTVNKPFATLNGVDLGTASQDMAAYDGKLYVIAQGSFGKSDGTLTVIDSKTLRQVARYQSELSELGAPTHLAVVDKDHIYIRHAEGVSCFSETTKKATLVEGSKGADKHPMIALGGKVFFHTANELCTIDESGKITARQKFDGKISGIAKADDSHIYLSYTTDEAGFIALIKVADSSVEKTNELPLDQGGKGLAKQWASTSTITAKGDTVYFGEGAKSSIYRHLFKSGETREMWSIQEGNPEHTQTYQTPAVHPITGMVYYATMKGWGPDYKINTIYELDLKGDQGKLGRKWDDLVSFPAGFFFPYAK